MMDRNASEGEEFGVVIILTHRVDSILGFLIIIIIIIKGK